MFEGIPGKLLEIDARNALFAGGALVEAMDSGPAGVRFGVQRRYPASRLRPGEMEGWPRAIHLPRHGDRYGEGGLVAEGVPLEAVTGGPAGFTLLFCGAIDDTLDGAILEAGEGEVRCHLRVYQGDLYFQHGGSNAESRGVTHQVVVPGLLQAGEPLLVSVRVWPDGRAELRGNGTVRGSTLEPSTLDFTGLAPQRIRIGWKEPGGYLACRIGVLATFGRALADAELAAAEREARGPGGPDRMAPILESLAFSPAEVDVSRGAAAVRVTASICDGASGVRAATASFYGPASHAASGAFALTGGNLHDGAWTAVISIPQHAPRGEWTLGEVVMTDRAGNGRILHDEIAAAGFPTRLRVLDPDAVPEPDDRGDPNLFALCAAE